jgi:YcaO-like protein with predicted kinase domain
MHGYLLDMMGGLDEESAKQMLDVARGRDPIVTTLLYEASLSFIRPAALRRSFGRAEVQDLLSYTPLINIKSSLLDDRELHYQWIRLFEANISEHRELPSLDAAGLPAPFGNDALASALSGGLHIRDIYESAAKRTPSVGGGAVLSAEETARHALEKLQEIGAVAGEETRHVSSLSPHGFLRKWRVEVAVRSGRHDFTFSGNQTSYGKGLTLDAARASYAMEMVERCSSFAGFGPDGVLGYVKPYPLAHARYSELRESGQNALNPNSLSLEAPYADEPLYWMEAEEQGSGGPARVLVPAQCIFLFCNLDEINLFSGLGSTGLASGNTMAQARVSALLEVIERDAEATTLYDPSRCFRIEAQGNEMASLLSDYEAKGVHVCFQDMSREFGVPCYKSFVVGSKGQIIKGTGAHLDGKRALLSALTETPYPYPGGPPSSPGPEGLPVIRFEDLPNYGAGDPARDLAILEAVLTANGYRPIYVDLTRKDLGIPVVKAVVPGMELMADFDQFSRVSPRLFANYLKTV